MAASDNQAAPAPATPAPSPAAIALAPLTDEDMVQLGTGCSCDFQSDAGTLIHTAQDKAMLRINGKLEICPMPEAQQTAFSGGEGSFECNGYRIALKPEGPVEQGENDDHGRDATLTVMRGDQSSAYKGAVACAC